VLTLGLALALTLTLTLTLTLALTLTLEHALALVLTLTLTLTHRKETALCLGTILVPSRLCSDFLRGSFAHRESPLLCLDTPHDPVSPQLHFAHRSRTAPSPTAGLEKSRVIRR
jgi:hypothetical protein